jgi:NADPH-dependent ferric siderophore reductase
MPTHCRIGSGEAGRSVRAADRAAGQHNPAGLRGRRLNPAHPAHAAAHADCPAARRVRLPARPGRDAAGGGRREPPGTARYTIRQLDAAARLLTLDIVRHGDGPGERWVRSARPGDKIEGIGPRGKITTSAAADWHLFIGDESALPGTFAMTEALPPDRPATLVLEIPEESDEQDLAAVASTRISWLHRLGAPAGDPSALAAEAAEIELPPGRGHAYLFGEATVVSRLREVLAGRGRPGPDVTQGLLGSRPRQRQPRRARPRRLIFAPQKSHKSASRAAPTDIPRTRRHSAAHPGTPVKMETKTSPEQAKRRCRRLSAMPIDGGQGQDRTVDLPLSVGRSYRRRPSRRVTTGCLALRDCVAYKRDIVITSNNYRTPNILGAELSSLAPRPRTQITQFCAPAVLHPAVCNAAYCSERPLDDVTSREWL